MTGPSRVVDRHPHVRVTTEVVDDHVLHAAAGAIPAMSVALQETDDVQEGVCSFVERRPARWTAR